MIFSSWKLCLVLLFAVLSPVAALPEPDASGDYHRRTLHTVWKVVDPDPAGLNGRLAQDFPQQWDNPHLPWPETDVLQWPVVATFKSGQTLTAVTGNLGVIFHKDKTGRSWLMVEHPDGHGICFVRANARFIRPDPICNEIHP